MRSFVFYISRRYLYHGELSTTHDVPLFQQPPILNHSLGNEIDQSLSALSSEKRFGSSVGRMVVDNDNVEKKSSLLV